MRLPALLRRLRADEQAATAIEFGLLGAFMIGLILGVLQVGISMQQYNALRAVAAETARHAVVQYQTRNELTGQQLAFYAQGIAGRPPYNLPSEGLQIRIDEEDTPRVAGTVEMTFTIRSQVHSIVEFAGLHDFYINYSRPIFLIDND